MLSLQRKVICNVRYVNIFKDNVNVQNEAEIAYHNKMQQMQKCHKYNNELKY